MEKQLPIGITSFRELRQNNYIYVDKTQLIEYLITNYKYVLLARPKGFGKSITLTTLEELFKGNKSLFEGLAIAQNQKWEFKPYPVIKLNFRIKSNTAKTFEIGILKQIQEVVEELLPGREGEFQNFESVEEYLKQIVKMVYVNTGRPAVILIDNYDYPLLSTLFNLETAQQIWEIIRRLILNVKDCGEMVKFMFITGLTPLLKSIPFEVTPVEDITLDSHFSNICGFMYEEVVYYFDHYLQGVDLEELKKWYYGYNFMGEILFNPIDILGYLRNNNIPHPYWYNTLSTTIFFKVIKSVRFYSPELENLVMPEKFFSGINLYQLLPEQLIFYFGITTIEEMRETFMGPVFVFKPANLSVQIHFNDEIIRFLTNRTNIYYYKKQFYYAFKAGDINKFRRNSREILKNIDPDHFVKYRFDKWRGIHITILYGYFMSLGAKIKVFNYTHEEIDLHLELEGRHYIIRISNGESLKELLRRRYHDLIKAKKVTLLGLDFNRAEFNFSRIDWEIKEKYGTEI